MRRAGIAATIAVAMGCTLAAAQAGGGQGDRPQSGTRDPQSASQGGATQPGTRGGSTPQSAPGNAQSVTITGCVQQQGSQTSADASSSNARGLVLTSARVSGRGAAGAGADDSPANDKSRPGGAPSATGTTGGQFASTTYVLEGDNLQQHVGHQVQVTGVIMPSAAGGTQSRGGISPNDNRSEGKTDTRSGSTTGSGSTTPESSSRTGVAGTALGEPRLRVTSVVTLSMTCAPQ